jgi:hypothetical protein
MKKSKISLSLVCSVLTLCFLSAEPSIKVNPWSKKLIVGEWSLNTSKGGLGTDTFNEDGTSLLLWVRMLF